jgi:hypothetical protein
MTEENYNSIKCRASKIEDYIPQQDNSAKQPDFSSAKTNKKSDTLFLDIPGFGILTLKEVMEMSE